MLAWKPVEIVALGVSSLFRHPGRSLLTMTGILFGVCAVIATMAVTEGIGRRMQQEVLRLGATNIIVKAVNPYEGQGADEQESSAAIYGLTYEDAARIRAGVPDAEVIVPVRELNAGARNGRHRNRVRVLGTVPWYLDTYPRRLRRGGRWMSQLDMEKAEPVCVLNPGAAQALFPQQDPVGASLRLTGFRNSDYYRVIGVLAAGRDTGGSASGEAGRTVYLPLTTMNDRFGELVIEQVGGTRKIESCELHEITVKLDDPDRVEPAAQIVTGLLETYHRGDLKDWEVRVPLERLRALERTKWLFVVLGVSIAAISLLVGGIGIMNIMLASVTERTREIGIRRAMGARRRDIIGQFLVETMVLSVVGGVVGVPVGWLLAANIPDALAWAAEKLGVSGEQAVLGLSHTAVPPAAIAVALGTSLVVGVVSGLYPAYRAAQMDPIKALRHE